MRSEKITYKPWFRKPKFNRIFVGFFVINWWDAIDINLFGPSLVPVINLQRLYIL